MSSRPARLVLLSIVAAVTSLAPAAGAAVPADFCASMGLTNATVRPILGSHVSANVSPNAGQDLGDCLIYDLKSRNASADVEVYPAGLASSLTDAYGGGSKTHKHVTGLTPDAKLVTGKNNGYRHGGPTLFFTTPNAFVTIDGYPPETVYIGKGKRVRPATTAKQVTRLAQLVYPNVK